MRPAGPDLPVTVVEDSDEDFVALNRVLRMAFPHLRVTRYRCGEDLLEQLARRDERLPALIVLDLNLPGLDGREVLRRLREAPRTRHVPIVILSTSSHPRDVRLCYEQGANAYHVKAMNFGAFREGVETFIRYWLERVRLPVPQEMEQP